MLYISHKFSLNMLNDQLLLGNDGLVSILPISPSSARELVEENKEHIVSLIDLPELQKLFTQQLGVQLGDPQRNIRLKESDIVLVGFSNDAHGRIKFYCVEYAMV